MALILIDIVSFLLDFEEIYVGGDPEHISRCRLCMFQLIHLPSHIEWNGSIRLGSQATVERAIGEMGHKIRSRKAPFANLANLILERELVKLLLLYYPELDVRKPASKHTGIHPFSEKNIKDKDRKTTTILSHRIQAICAWLNLPFDIMIPLRMWSKVRLPSGKVLSSLNVHREPSRVLHYFEAQGSESSPIFGQAISFLMPLDTEQLLVLFHPIVDMKMQLGRWVGCKSQKMSILPVADIVDIIGVFIWSEDRIHILRKHPAFTMLSVEEVGIDDEADSNGE